MTTAAEAIASITSGMTVEQLRALANTVDADVGNATLLLYSGGVGAIDPLTGLRAFGAKVIAETLADGTSVSTIANSEVFAFLNDQTFQTALLDAMNADIAANGSASAYYDGRKGER